MRDNEKTRDQLIAELEALRARCRLLEGTVAADAREIAEELTLHDQTQEQLAETQRRFQEIVEKSQAGYFFVDQLGRFRMVNDAWLQMHGYESSDEIIGQHFLSTQPEPFTEQAEQTIDTLLCGGPIPPGVAPRKCKDGSIGYHLFSINPVLKDGEVVGLEGFLIDTTERIHIEQALRESEGKFRSIVESSPMGMHLYHLEEDGRLVFAGANPAADTILGTDNAQFVGQTIEEAFPPLKGTEVPDRYRQAAADGVDWRAEQITYEDERIAGAFEVYAFQTSPGNMVALFTEITERKQMEEALRQSYQEWEEIFEAIGHPAFIFDGNRRVIRANRAAMQAVGLTADQILGLCCNDVLCAGGPHNPECPMEQSIRSGQIATNPMEIKGLQGIYLLSCTPIYDESGKLDRIIHIATDITQQKQAEAALIESETRYRELFENANDIVYTHDLSGNFLSMNSRAEPLTGYTPQELLEMSIADIVDPEQLPRAQSMTQLKVQDGGDTVYEIDVLTKDGGTLPVEVSTRLLYQDDEPVAVQGIARDISERRRVAEREREIQRRAEEQEKLAAVGQLAAGIAHDFNNLLTGIMGHAEMMQYTPGFPDSARNDARVIQQQGQRAAQLIRQILDFSRKSIIQRRPLDLLPFLEEQVRLLQRTIHESIQIHLAAEAGQYVVHADTVQIQQILTNLVVNARDAMPGGGRLEIVLSRQHFSTTDAVPFPEMASGDWIVLTIADTGTGMPGEVLDRIFEPFFTTKEVGRGSGLGLSQVYGIVRQHEAFIDCNSHLGEGTEFLVYFPAQSTASEPQPRQEQPDLPRGHGELLLVVEDNELVLDVLTRMLDVLGYRVLPAEDGESALRTFEQHQHTIDLVITDVVMPKMGGMELHQRLQSVAPGTKVVLISGYPLGEEELSGTISGWTTKPPSIGKLARVVRDALHGDSPSQAE